MAVSGAAAEAPRLRLADPADLPGILAIERASFPSPWTEPMFAEELKNDWSHLWVIEAGPERSIVAFCVFWVAADEIHLLNIAVAPPWRRRGLARHLLTAIIAFAEARVASHVVLEVRPSNTPAQRLYRQFDFRPVGLRPNYYADNGEDAILMLRMVAGRLT
ncbi:MAG: ribosomal protein S18-alanine N-acetyltransferase [Deltaproteobacteria bacterium]|nr:ribosomal protein S18-alanine N-acetyltransferase [Deltaproteobacteria bacterium]